MGDAIFVRGSFYQVFETRIPDALRKYLAVRWLRDKIMSNLSKGGEAFPPGRFNPLSPLWRCNEVLYWSKPSFITTSEFVFGTVDRKDS